MKSMETFSHSSFEIGKRSIKSKLLVHELCTLALDINAHKMFYILFHFKLIEPSSNGQPCGSFTVIPCQQHVMLFLYDFCAHLSSGTQIWDYFHFISPSSRLMPLILFFACNFAKIMLCKEVLHTCFTYFPFKFTLLTKFAYKL